ncbi:hypothetical protein ANTRET_LOCUS10692 [Anthophora retusa]
MSINTSIREVNVAIGSTVYQYYRATYRRKFSLSSKREEEKRKEKKKKEWQGERKTYLSQFRLTDAAMEAVARERWPVWANQPLLPFPEQGLLSAKNALAKRRNFYRRASRLCKLSCYKEDAGVG